MDSKKTYVEHANISVINTEKTIHFLITAIPEWAIRGKGEMDWFGETVQWFHVGDNASYVAVQSGGVGKVDNWKESWTGVKHIGIVVPDLDSVIQRLTIEGYEVDHFGADHPHRRNAYFIESHGIQFEFIEYFSLENTEKNDYIL